MTDDPPLDLHAVAADDAALEALRADAGEDAALVLLRELLLDVERDLPQVPAGHGSTVLTLAVPPSRRLARGGTVVAVLTAGALSLGGVAAASTFAPADSALHGFGEAFRSAAGAVVGAVSPPARAGRPTTALPSAATSPSSASTAVAPVAPRPAPTGAAVAAASRSRASAGQVDQLLDEAAALLKAGRTATATKRLDLAERKLADVLPADRADLPARLADLRAQAQQAGGPQPKPKPDVPKQDAPATQKSKAEPPRKAPGKQDREGSQDAPQVKQDKPTDLHDQSSSDASMNPRA